MLLYSHNLIRMVFHKVNVAWPEVVMTQVDEDVDLSAARLSQNSGGYVNVYISGMGQPVSMHRYVMGLKPGDKRDVHHLNGDKTDNRRENLKIVSHKENVRLNGPTKKNTTGLKGVIKLKSGRYRSELGEVIDGKYTKKYIGTFATVEEAGLARDRVVLAKFAGGFLNFPDHVHQSIIPHLA